MDIGPPEIIILAVIVLIVFGGSKIPQFAKNLGKAKNEFEKGLKEGSAPDKPAASPAPAAEASAAPAPAAPAPAPAPADAPVTAEPADQQTS